ncbi:MAG TPA: hypothetical protein ENI77_06570 [Nitrospirae bacterium]|nr:hypothetical protein [Nitrospirota bacterium]
MSKKTLLFAIGLAGLIAFGSGAYFEPRDGGETRLGRPNDVVATVGSVKITVGDLDREFNRYKNLLRFEEAKSAVDNLRVKKSLLYRLIDESLLYLEAEKLGIEVSEKELELELRGLLSEYDQAKLGLVLAKNEMNFEEWKKGVKKSLRARKLVEREIDSKIKVGEKEIKQFYKKNSDQFKWPERVRAMQIMVEDETTAERVRKKLTGGADFGKIAKRYSQSPDSMVGGDLGFFGRGQMPPEFEAAVFDLKEGEISSVIESIYGFHLFKVVKKEKPRGMKYKEARDRINQLLLERKREKEFKSWIKQLTENNTISINREVLSEISS